jgi:hypothetical protein
MKTKPIKPNPETPNRKLLRLSREIIKRFAAQGKEFTIDDVAGELYKNVIATGDTDLLRRLAREGTYQFAYDEWQDWHDQQGKSA